MAAQISATAPPQQPDVTWRDVATPTSRASRRRWTASYALLLILLAAAVLDDAFAVDGTIPLIVIVALAVLFGMLRRGTRRIAALDHPDLDERDIEARNSAYRVAYALLLIAVAAGLGLVAVFGLEEFTRTTRIDAQLTETRTAWSIDPWALIGAGGWIALWAVFLPTGVLAWREPDALEDETGDGGVTETTRDALLGLALAAGLAVSLIAQSQAGVIPFIAAVAVLGALGRHRSGQPVLSRQRRWRLAVGIAMIVIVVVIGMVTSGGGAG